MSKLMLHNEVTATKQCSSCVQEIATTESYIGCNQCFMWYHVGCMFKTSRSAMPKLTKMSMWFCSPKCEEEHKNQSNLKNLVSEIKMPENPTIKDLCHLLIQHMEKTKTNHTNNTTEIHHLRNEINYLKQQQLQNHVLVSGFPIKINTDVFKVVEKINTIIKSSANMNYVYVDKLEIRTQQRTEWLIRVDFYHQSNKQIFMDALKSHGPLYLHQVLDQQGSQQNNGPVYIRDELTAYYSKLAYETRKIKKELQFQYCWYKNGKMLLRKTQKSKIFSFRSFSDLEVFKLKINNIKNNLNESNYADADASNDFETAEN
jgi:hypothetical protein